MRKFRLGIVGCGSISERYFANGALSSIVEVVSCTDHNLDAALTMANRFGVKAVSYVDMLNDETIDLVVNLTPPAAHLEVGLRALNAGKHVYSEKPLAASLGEARELITFAADIGLRVGCAPDTFFGAAHQTARQALDSGSIGSVLGGAIAFATRGMESWHPNPSFFFKRGGGPLLDLGPYYLSQAINLLGPVRAVWSRASMGYAERIVGSGALTGQIIKVEVPTTVNGLISFQCGVDIPITASWDVWKHGRNPIELYGTDGSLINPSPVFFDGPVRLSTQGEDWTDLPIDHFAFSQKNREARGGIPVADYRGIGVIDMVMAIRERREHRANGQLALHVLEILQGLEYSNGNEIIIESTCERPMALQEGNYEGALATNSQNDASWSDL